jgi:SAM-dependent methyltransferase
MDVEAYWDLVDRTVKPTEVTWSKPDLGSSLKLITHANISKEAAILDVGCGGSMLFDDLLELGYTDLTCMDVSGDAYEPIRQRLGNRARDLCCVTADVTKFVLPSQSFDLWHDQAVFHLLADRDERERYLRNLRTALRIGGYFILAAISDEDDRSYVGFEAERYSPEKIQATLGPDFEIITVLHEDRLTPFKANQTFIYALFRYIPE